VDYGAIAAEFLRALRGKRSQTAFSRRLGYKSNVAYLWEHQRNFPTGAKALWAAGKVGIDVREALRGFFRSEPAWFAQVDPASPEGISALLKELQGNQRLLDLAERSGRNRFAIARWMSGRSEPSLSELFMLIECSSLRLVDFIEHFANPKDMPSIREKWEQLQIARDLAYDAPWTQAVLRALELKSYAELPKHRLGWIAKRVGISREEEQRCLELLLKSGQIVWEKQRWQLREVMTLDTRTNPQKASKLRTWWAKEAIRRNEEGARGLGYNLFSISTKDLEKLRELQRAYMNQMRALIAQSKPEERVVLAVSALMDLEQAE
jgi:transcriptional regulator with XRE-family HTH domain